MKKKIEIMRKINLIYPKKKGQKITITEEDKVLLKKRYIVENCFSWIKNYRRIRNRYEHHINNYRGFCYIALIEVIACKFH